jgi:hypothetical protein
MAKHLSYYYLLFVLLIMGGFSAMAQNNYGSFIMGGVAITFSMLFLIQLISLLKSKGKVDWLNFTELMALIVIGGILAMRIFYIRFDFVEQIYGVAAFGLFIVYCIKLITYQKQVRPKAATMANYLALFHLSMAFFTLSLASTPFIPIYAEWAGIAGFAILLAFIALGALSKPMLIDGNKISLFRFVNRIKDRSVLLASLFILFSLYLGLTKFDIIPTMYSDEYPQAYFKMLNTGNKELTDGKEPVSPDEFIKAYDQFVKKYSNEF